MLSISALFKQFKNASGLNSESEKVKKEEENKGEWKIYCLDWWNDVKSDIKVYNRFDWYYRINLVKY